MVTQVRHSTAILKVKYREVKAERLLKQLKWSIWVMTLETWCISISNTSHCGMFWLRPLQTSPHHGKELHRLKKRITSPCLPFNYPTLARPSWFCGRGMRGLAGASLLSTFGHFGSARPHMVPAVSSSPTNLSVLKLIWLMVGQSEPHWGVGLRSVEQSMNQ